MSEPGLLVGRKTRQPTASVNLAKNQSRERRQFRRLDPTLPVPQSFAPPERIQHHLIQDVLVRNRHQEFIRFLNVIDARAPAKLAVHAIVDNYAARKHPKVLEWRARHPRFVFHFTPTSASWLNAVEGLFALLSAASSVASSVPFRNSRIQFTT